MITLPYTDFLLSHYHHPQNYGLDEDFDFEAKGENPMCGDFLTARVKMAGQKIKKISFEHKGCVISRAAASIFSEYMRGKNLSGIKKIEPDTVLKIINVPITPARWGCALMLFKLLKSDFNSANIILALHS